MNDLLEANVHQPGAARRRPAMLRHEWKIAQAGLVAVVRKPLDLLTVLVAVPIALLVLKSWIARQPQQLLLLQTFAIGFLVAFYCVKALLGRCAYHRTDGIVAADAQRTSEQWAFALPLFGMAAALGFAYLVIVNAQRPALWLTATALGALSGFTWAQIVWMLRERQPIFSRWLRPSFGRRAQPLLVASGAIIGGACAIIPLSLPVIGIATAAISIIASILLARIDASAIRYRTMMGHSSWVIIRSHISPLLPFFAPFAAALTMAPHWAMPALAAVLGVAVTVFMAMRVLAYQSFHQRIADWFVTGLIAVAAMAGLALPPAAPVALLVGIVWLARRAPSQTWLIV